MQAVAPAPLLVPVDFSLCSDSVVETAAELAQELGSPLVVLHVAETPSGLPTETLVRTAGAGAPVSVGELLHAESSAALPRYTRQAASLGVRASALTRHGEVVDTILAEAERIQARMVVMGTHGRTGLTRLVMGSVAESVLRRATVPVLTVRTLHKPSCEAASCDRCTSGHLPSDELLDAESMG